MTADDLRDTVQGSLHVSGDERQDVVESLKNGTDTGGIDLAREFVHRPSAVSERLVDEFSGDSTSIELTNRELWVLQMCLIKGRLNEDVLSRIRELTEPIERVDPAAHAPDYRGENWPKQREKALERADHQCERCGVTNKEHEQQSGAGLHVHHQIPYRRFNTSEAANGVSNLQVLCNHCHKSEETA